MNKVEFMNRVKRIDTNAAVLEPNDGQWKTIEYVYNWHPSIDNVRGKEQIAYLYAEFGIRIIEDMMQTAIMAMEAEQRMLKAKEAYEAAVADYTKLRKGTK